MKSSAKLMGLARQQFANPEFIYTFLSRIVQMFSTIGLLKVITHLLPNVEYANYSLMLSVVGLMVAIPYTAIDQGVLRYVSDYRKNDYGIFFTTVMGSFLIFSVVYLFLASLAFYLIPLSDFWPKSIFYIYLFGVTEAFRIILSSFELAERNRKIYFYLCLSETALKLICQYIIFTSKFTKNSLSVLNAYTITNFILVSYLMIRRRKLLTWGKGFLEKKQEIFIHVWRYSSPFMILSIFAWFQSLGMRWILNLLANKVAVANFSALSAIATLPGNALIGLLSAFALPILFEIEANNPGVSREKIWKFLSPLVLIFIGMIIFSFFFHSQIVNLALGKAYLPLSYGLWVLTIGASLNSLLGYLSFEFMIAKKPHLLLYSTIVPGFLNLTVGSFLVAYFGFDGAIWSYVLINAIGLGLIVYKQRKL